MANPKAPSLPNLEVITSRLAQSRERMDESRAAHLLTIEEQFTAVQRGDWEALLRSASPDVTFEMFAPPELPLVTRARGVAPVREAIERNFSALSDQEPVISNVVAQENVVVLFGTERGKVRATGQSYHVEFVYRFTFHQGLLENVRIIVAKVS